MMTVQHAAVELGAELAQRDHLRLLTEPPPPLVKASGYEGGIRIVTGSDSPASKKSALYASTRSVALRVTRNGTAYCDEKNEGVEPSSV